jgi:hypothetical protein
MIDEHVEHSRLVTGKSKLSVKAPLTFHPPGVGGYSWWLRDRFFWGSRVGGDSYGSGGLYIYLGAEWLA